MDEMIAQLGQWSGYTPKVTGRFEAGRKGPRSEVWIELMGDNRPRQCSGCGHYVTAIHDATPPTHLEKRRGIPKANEKESRNRVA